MTVIWCLFCVFVSLSCRERPICVHQNFERGDLSGRLNSRINTALVRIPLGQSIQGEDGLWVTLGEVPLTIRLLDEGPCVTNANELLETAMGDPGETVVRSAIGRPGCKLDFVDPFNWEFRLNPPQANHAPSLREQPGRTEIARYAGSVSHPWVAGLGQVHRDQAGGVLVIRWSENGRTPPT